MAEDPDWKRKREREDELEHERHRRRGGSSPESGHIEKAGGTELLAHILDQIEPLVEQTHQLYNMYFAGAEKRPPLEQRARLDQLMQQAQNIPKIQPLSKFRFQSVYSHYRTYVERWEKLLKKMESGNR